MPKKNFESALKRLEEIARDLEGAEVSLDHSVKLFEEGRELIEFCTAKLNEAESKLKKLTGNEEEGFRLEPM